MSKCQKCSKAATLHITEVVTDEQYEELHLCEECAHKYLYEDKKPALPADGEDDAPAAEAPGARHCPVCGMKFVEFRNTGRLGCPHDYQEFREELTPLLENIHGDTRHCGKVPRRLPEAKQAQRELLTLRQQLHAAVNKEQYEEAARIRDRIRQLEEN